MLPLLGSPSTSVHLCCGVLWRVVLTLLLLLLLLLLQVMLMMSTLQSLRARGVVPHAHVQAARRPSSETWQWHAKRAVVCC